LGWEARTELKMGALPSWSAGTGLSYLPYWLGAPRPTEGGGAEGDQ